MSSILKRFARKERSRTPRVRGQRYGGNSSGASIPSSARSDQAAELRRAMASGKEGGK